MYSDFGRRKIRCSAFGLYTSTISMPRYATTPFCQRSTTRSGIRSKRASRVASGRPCCMALAAGHISFSGIRRPCNWRLLQIVAYRSDVSSPTGACVTQQARQFSWQIQDGHVSARFLIHDRDTKFKSAFDTVFTSEDVTIIRTPVRAPNANAFAERWVRSVREECLDRILILNERHLNRALTTYVDYYNHAQPRQGIEQRCPIPLESAARVGPIERRDILGGVIHDYRRAA